MSHEEYFESNIKLLEEKNPGLAAQLKLFPITGVRFVPSPTGATVAHLWDVHTQQWVAVCDTVDPAAHAESDVEKLYTSTAKVFVLLGLGVGYFASAFAKRLAPYQRLAIFDTNPNCYKASLYATDMTPLLNGSCRVDFFIGENVFDSMRQWWLTLEIHEKFYIAHPMLAGYTSICDKDSYKDLLEKSVEMIRYHHVGLSTLKQFGQDISNNDIANIPEYYITPGMQELEGLWKDRPAVCVAAGPSLQKNLRHLLSPAIRKQVALLTVGTTYAAMQGMGISADIVTTIDFQRLNFTDQFQHVPLNERTALVYLHSTYPDTVRRWPGPRFVGLNSSDTVHWIRQYAEPKMDASQIQTVAHLNILTAIILGANPIILLGQDLSLPRSEHHAPGARVQDLSVEEAPDSHTQIVDIYGNTRWTRVSFQSMRTVFEQIFSQNTSHTYINCTEGGIALAGATNMPFLEAVRNFTPHDTHSLNLPDTIFQKFQTYKPNVRWSDIRESLDYVLRGAEILKECSHRVVQWAKEYEESERDEHVRESLHENIINTERYFNEHIQAASMFFVRRFDVIEKESTLSFLQREEDKDKLLSAKREYLTEWSRAYIDEFPMLHILLRNTSRRLHDVLPSSLRKKSPTPKELLRMLSRESFAAVAKWLENPDVWTVEESESLLRKMLSVSHSSLVPSDVFSGGASEPSPGIFTQWHNNGQASTSIAAIDILRLYIRFRCELYRHRQQYIQAASLLSAWGMAPAHVARCYRRIDIDNVNTGEILPKYFQNTDSYPEYFIPDDLFFDALLPDVQPLVVSPEENEGISHA